MKIGPMPDIHELRRYLAYDPASGLLRWISKPARGTNAGAIAGRIGVDGYAVVGFKKKTYKAHRLAWFLMTGEWPETIDHIDGDKANNRLSNLRPATYSQNQANKDVRGAHFCKRNGRWQAAVKIMGRSVWLGYFDNPQSAQAAYTEAAARIFGEFARQPNPIAMSTTA
jgi:hypothetical protein